MANQRKTVFMSLGSLVAKVDATPFMRYIIGTATQLQKKFDLNTALEKALDIADDFNEENVTVKESKSQATTTKEKFQAEILALFQLNESDVHEFWQKWNDMVTVGDIDVRVQQLKDEYASALSVELYSDSNFDHLNKIAHEAKKSAMNLDKGSIVAPTATTFAGFPLSATCVEKRGVVKVIAEMLEQAKQLKKLDGAIVIFGDPENIKDLKQRARAQKKFNAVDALCQTYGVKLVKQNQLIESLLKDLFQKPAVQAERPAVLSP